MKIFVRFIRLFVLLGLVHVPTSALALEVAIPDPGLNAAIRDALKKPNGPLTDQDLLGLTNLIAESRNISNLQGLEAAHNLTFLDLEFNQLTNLTFPSGLTNLNVLDLSLNPLVHLALPADLTNLIDLDVFSAQLNRVDLPPTLGRLDVLNLSINDFTNLTLPPGLTSLTDVELFENQLTSFTLPADMTNLLVAKLFFNRLTNVILPGELKNLNTLNLDNNQFTDFTVSSNLSGLQSLELRGNRLRNFDLAADLPNLRFLFLNNNQLTNVSLPAGLTGLASLQINQNQLKSFSLPGGMTNLALLSLSDNQLTNLSLPADLQSLVQLGLQNNRLTTLSLPGGLTNLTILVLNSNQLASLTLPPDLIRLATLLLDGDPLTTFVLSQPLASSDLAATVTALRNQGVLVFTYPPAIQLVWPQLSIGAFEFGITGPPGIYTVLASADLAAWNEVGIVSNTLGSIFFVDTTSQFFSQRFYRALLLQTPPTNMVFIPRGTFALGTPANEVNRQPDEGPQTTVTISHGFWMGKFEVTQREYLAVIGSNPSGFPGDLDRPVESVSWLDATNYCAKLTQRELAAGHIPPGSHYCLPTEAEWEYAARAGTTTRFSYGDDTDFTDLINHAWYSANSGFGTHPVGQKAPNVWGLNDMEGNVLEWCQDWYGPFPGGSVIDPQGPVSNAQGVKVIRGGAWDSFAPDCRSGRRLTEGVSPFITDFILGFRVVLEIAP